MPVWLTRSCELDVEGNLILDGGTEQAARYSKGRKDRIAKRRNADGSGDKFCRGGNECAEDDVGERQDHVKIIEVPFVVHVVMGVQPAKPGRRFQPASLGYMHAIVKVLIQEIIKDQRQQGAAKNSFSQQPL